MGPWTHGVPSATRTTYRDVDYGPNAAIDYVELQLRFFDHWMKGIDDGYTSEAPVRIFVMGDNVWRDEYEWPLARTEYVDLFLRSGARLVSEPPHRDEPLSFRYDPRHPATIPPAADRDSTLTEADVLTYTTDPFVHDTEITGHILAHLWVASTAPDTDITARLFEVDGEGELRRLTAAPGVLRARYRSTEDPQHPRPLTPGEPAELTISLGYTSYVVPSGHRLRLFVTGSLFPDLHLNVMEPFVSMDQAVTATQTMHQDRRYPSRIVIPIIPR